MAKRPDQKRDKLDVREALRAYDGKAPAKPDASSYTGVLDACARSLGDLQSRVEAERVRAQAVMRAVAASSEETVGAVLEGVTLTETLVDSLGELLVMRLGENRRKAKGLAEALVTAASATTSDRETQIEWRALAHAMLGNVLRVEGDLVRATKEMVIARGLVDRETTRPDYWARVLGLEASVLIDRGEYQRAIAMLKEALGARGVDEDVKVLLLAVLARGYVGAEMVPEAKATNLEVVSRVNPRRQKRIALTAVHNLAYALFKEERYEEAERMLEQFGKEFEEGFPAADRARKHWIYGLIAVKRGQLRIAVEKLEGVIEVFKAEDLMLDAAFCWFDLTEVYARLGAPHLALESLTRAAPIFRSSQLTRELLAVLLSYRKMIEAGNLTVEIAIQANKRFVGAWKKPLRVV